MSNEPKKPGDGAGWSMPDPVFRSSKGQSLKGSSPDPGESENDENTAKEPDIIMENEPKDIVEATTDPQGESAVEKKAKGDKLGRSMTAVGLVALLAAGVIFLLFYFLFFRQAATGTP
ncbi:hypothetical protein BH20ACI2_BH20ACI2_14810 [soil metagenome]